MAEVRLPLSVIATLDPRVADHEWEEGRQLAPGSFSFAKQGWYGKPELGEWDVIWYACPCGCGSVGCLAVGEGVKPDGAKIDRPTWKWDGDREHPTLEPSIHHVGHWHGYLRAGVWIQA